MIFCDFCLISKIKSTPFSYNKLVQYRLSQVDTPDNKICYERLALPYESPNLEIPALLLV